MAKKIRFSLKLNNVIVNDIAELKENFNLEEVTAYFVSGKLLRFLEDRYYEEETEKIRDLSKDDKNFAKKICKIFGVEYTGEEFDVDDIARQNEILAVLKQHTADKEILSHYKQVALTQEDLADLLDDEVTPIYLYGEQFSIPMSIENRKYIGILGTPKIKIAAKTAEELTARGITFENVNLPKHLLPKPEIVQGRAKITSAYDRYLDSKKLITFDIHYIDPVENMWKLGYYSAKMIKGEITLNSKVRILRAEHEIYRGSIFSMIGFTDTDYNSVEIIDCIKHSNSKDDDDFKNKFRIHFDKILLLEEGDIIEAYVVEQSKSE